MRNFAISSYCILCVFIACNSPSENHFQQMKTLEVPLIVFRPSSEMEFECVKNHFA